MAETKNARRPGALLLALVIVIVANGLALPALSQIWKSPGSWGLDVTWNWVVASVDPGGAAAIAGVKVGDHIDAATLSLEDRLALAISLSDAGLISPPGRRMTIHLLRGGVDRTTELVSLTQPVSLTLAADIILNRLTALIFTIVGAMLFLLKPSRMTTAFFAFAIGSTMGSPVALTNLPATVYLAGEVLTDIMSVAGLVGFVIFLLRFPNDSVTSWRQVLDKGAVIIFVALALLAAFIDLRYFVQAKPLGGLPSLFGTLTTIVATVGVVALANTYLHLRGEGRQRIKWVAAALIVYYAVDLVIRHFPVNYNYILRVLYLSVPFSVAYAVLRHRVIDVNFFISRALVYGILTSAIAAIFTLVDMLFFRILDVGRVGLIVEIIIALAIGFWLNGLHRTLDPLVDRLFFHQRYLGECRLERAAIALPHAQTSNTIDDYLVCEPVDALGLSSAALFTRTEEGRFVRGTSVGWPDEAAATLMHDDRIALSLVAEQSPIRLSEVHWARADMPRGAYAPVLAVPVVVRLDLRAIVLYGPHANGADLDVDEIASLKTLAQSASAAYDHLEALDLRKQVTEQRREIESLRAAAAQS